MRPLAALVISAVVLAACEQAEAPTPSPTLRASPAPEPAHDLAVVHDIQGRRRVLVSMPDGAVVREIADWPSPWSAAIDAKNALAFIPRTRDEGEGKVRTVIERVDLRTGERQWSIDAGVATTAQQLRAEHARVVLGEGVVYLLRHHAPTAASTAALVEAFDARSGERLGRREWTSAGPPMLWVNVRPIEPDRTLLVVSGWFSVRPNEPYRQRTQRIVVDRRLADVHVFAPKDDSVVRGDEPELWPNFCGWSTKVLRPGSWIELCLTPFQGEFVLIDGRTAQAVRRFTLPSAASSTLAGSDILGWTLDEEGAVLTLVTRRSAELLRLDTYGQLLERRGIGLGELSARQWEMVGWSQFAGPSRAVLFSPYRRGAELLAILDLERARVTAMPLKGERLRSLVLSADGQRAHVTVETARDLPWALATIEVASGRVLGQIAMPFPGDAHLAAVLPSR